MKLSANGRARLLLGLAAAIVFLTGLGSRDLWNPDEPRYAEVAREMLESGQFFVPHLNGVVYTQKPPLHFWAIAAAGGLRGGVDEVAARLPAALAAIAVVLLTFELGLMLFGYRAGIFAAIAFGTASKVLWQGRIGQIDMHLLFWVTLAMTLWTRGYLTRRRGFYLLFFAAAGCATLAKGPVGLLPPLFSVLVFLVVSGQKGEIKRLRLGMGLLLWAAVVLLWLVPAGFSGGQEYLSQIVFKQNVTRYVNPWHHFQPWYYYLTVIAGDFFPWSLLLPGALVVGWKSFQGEQRRSYLLALCWVLVTIVFFSVSPAKRSVYVLSMYPAMALLVGAFMDRLATEWPRFRAWLLVPLGLVAGILGLAAGLLPGLVAKRPETAIFEPWLPGLVTAMVALIAVGAAAAAVTAWKGRPAAAPAILGSAMAIAAVVLVVAVLPSFDRVKSARGLSAVLRQEMAPGETYAIFPRLDPQFVFYTRRFCEVPKHSSDDLPAVEEELHALARRPERTWVLVEVNFLRRLETAPDLVEVARDQDDNDGYVLLRTADGAAVDESLPASPS